MAGFFRKLMEFMFLGRGAGEGASISSGAPEGLKLIHTAMNSSEADMLRQVLADAGFHVEYVPSAGAGIFGTSGSNDVFVAAAEARDAAAFLDRYLSQNSAE